MSRPLDAFTRACWLLPLALALLALLALPGLPAAQGQAAPYYSLNGFPTTYQPESAYRLFINLTDSNVEGETETFELTVTNGSFAPVQPEGTGAVAANGDIPARAFATVDSLGRLNWEVLWTAPETLPPAGEEGAAIFNLTFSGLGASGNETYSLTLVSRAPLPQAPEEEATPDWALSLAWGGVALTAVMVAVAGVSLRRNRS